MGGKLQQVFKLLSVAIIACAGFQCHTDDHGNTHSEQEIDSVERESEYCTFDGDIEGECDSQVENDVENESPGLLCGNDKGSCVDGNVCVFPALPDSHGVLNHYGYCKQIEPNVPVCPDGMFFSADYFAKGKGCYPGGDGSCQYSCGQGKYCQNGECVVACPCCARNMACSEITAPFCVLAECSSSPTACSLRSPCCPWQQCVFVDSAQKIGYCIDKVCDAQ